MLYIFISHNWLVFVQHQIALDLSGTRFYIQCQELCCERLRCRWIRLWIELEEHVLRLIFGGMTNVLCEVNSTRSDQSRIKP